MAVALIVLTCVCAVTTGRLGNDARRAGRAVDVRQPEGRGVLATRHSTARVAPRLTQARHSQGQCRKSPPPPPAFSDVLASLTDCRRY